MRSIGSSIFKSGLNLSLALTILLCYWPATLFAQTIVQTNVQTSDDCEHIRTQLLNPQISDIVVAEGTYTCNKPIIVNRDGVSLSGKGRVILKLADHANCPLVILGNINTPPQPVHDLRLSNLILDGNRDHQDMECWGGPCDTGGTTVIRNNGVTIRGVHGALVSNMQIFRMRSGGLVTEKVCTKLHIDGLTAKDNYFDGLAGYETTDSLFENLDLSENLAAGISLDIHFHRNIFNNVRLSKNENVAVFIRDSNGNRFQNLRIQDSGNHGVFVSHVEGQVNTGPANNIFENLVVAGAKGNGFHLNDGISLGNELINPKFSNIKGKDIFEAVPGTLKVSGSMDAQECAKFLSNRTQGVSMNAWDRNIRAYREKGWLENRKN